MTSYLTRLHSCQQKAYISATINTIKRKKNKHLKFVKWWDDEVRYLYAIHRKWFKLYNGNKQNNFYKRKKNTTYDLFRKKQKQNIERISKSKYKFLNKLFCTNRIEGWKHFKRLTRTTTKTTLTANEIKIEFQKHFCEKLVPDSPQLVNHQRIVDEFLNNYNGYSDEFSIDLIEMNELLKNLPNGRKAGFSGSPYELYKYCMLETVNKMLCQLITSIMRHGIIPYHFNIALVTPLIKDTKKSLDCVKNIRPISVSDSITNIFEAILLKRLNEQVQFESKQFGFKPLSSYNHAIWCLY